jgi:uncharacterized protein (TIGR04255 family)
VPAKTVHIDVDHEFPHLSRAPIVEAVIAIGARPTVNWEEATIRPLATEKLTDYVFQSSQREYQLEAKMAAGKPPSQELRDLGWKGLRYTTTDKKRVIQFNRDGFAFSRLQPYGNWAELREEALRLWAVFVQIAAPTGVGRIGVRYINRIGLPAGEQDISNYVVPAPQPPPTVDLKLRSFIHHDVLEAPGYPYHVRVVKTLQEEEKKGCFLIFDIDVFTDEKLSIDDQMIRKHLEEMRWLKNSVFFSSITAKARMEFGEGANDQM